MGKNMEILQWPRDASLLRRKARAVEPEEFASPEFVEFVEALGQTMMDARGAGLAATQVSEHPGGEPWAVFVVRVSDRTWGTVCNPAIVSREGAQVAPEGCLSFAGVPEAMTAPESVVVHGMNKEGVGFIVTWDGELAHRAHHEVEHLSGRVMIDRMLPLKRRLFLKRVEEQRARRGR